MKRLFLFSLCVLNIAAASFAYAEKADSEKATDIAADQMTYDDVKQVNTFIGNVILTRGSLLMKAGRVVVTQDRAGYQSATLYAAPGALATFRQKRDGGPNPVCGLSKIARLVDGYANRLQVQERLTGQIADDMMARLGAAGTLVVLEAEHLCMTIRGAMKPGSTTTTSAVRGSLAQQSTRAEALSLLRG